MGLRGILAAGSIVAATMIVTPSAMADWNGGYIGGYTGAVLSAPPALPQAGIQGGYSFANGQMLFGIQAEMGIISSPSATFGDVGVSAQVGMIVGGKALFYATGGGGGWFTIGGIVPHYTFGLGIEFQVGGSGLTMFIEPRAIGIVGTGCCAVQVRAGLNWRP